MLYLYTVQNVLLVYTKPQHLLTAHFLHALPLQVAVCNVHTSAKLPPQLYRLKILQCLPAECSFTVLFSCLLFTSLGRVEVREIPWVSDVFRLQLGIY